MFGWRRRSEGFEWQEYVRTTILVRRADRQKRLDDARLAALAKVKDGADRGLNAGKKQVEAVQHAARDVAVNAGQAAANAAKHGAVAALQGAKKIGAAAREVAEQVPVPHVPTRVWSAGSIAAMYAADMPRRWRKAKKHLPTAAVGLAAIWGFGFILNPETRDTKRSVQVSSITTGSTTTGSSANAAAADSGTNGDVRGRAKALSGERLKINGQVVRLAGIEAPDPAQPCFTASGRRWSCGEAAQSALARLVRNQRIACEIQAVSKLDLPLAHCRSGETDIAAELVKGGHVFAGDGPYRTEEDAAKERKAGIWQSEAERPSVWRARVWEEAKRSAPDGCPIKGFVRSQGRTYTMPWSDDYGRRNVKAAKGERWFCSEEEAQAAGFRLSSQL